MTELPSTLDLSKPPKDHNLDISIKPIESPADTFARIFKDLVLFVFALALVGLIAFLCFRTLTTSTAQPEEKKWAMSILTAAAAGLIGYLIRK